MEYRRKSLRRSMANNNNMRIPAVSVTQEESTAHREGDNGELSEWIVAPTPQEQLGVVVNDSNNLEGGVRVNDPITNVRGKSDKSPPRHVDLAGRIQ